MSKLYSRIFGLAGANALSQLVQFSVVILLARNLGPTEIGKVFIGLVVANLLFAFFDFGSTTYFTRGLAKGEITQQEFLSQFRVRVALFGIINFAICCLALALGNLWTVATCSVALSQFLFQGLQSVAKSQIRLTSLAMAIIGDRVFCLLVVTLFAFNQYMSPELALLSWSAGQVLGSVLLAIRSFRKQDWSQKTSIRVAMAYSRHLHLGFFSVTNVLVTLDQAILGNISGTRQTGLFGAVSKWFVPMSMVSSSASLVVSNHAARISSNARAAIKETSKVWIGIVSVALAVSVGGWFISPVVDFLLGNQFEDSKQLIGFLAVSASIVFINQPLASLLQYFDQDKYVSKVVWITGAIYLVLLTVFLVQFQEQGALILAEMQIGLQLCILFFLLLGISRPRSSDIKNIRGASNEKVD